MFPPVERAVFQQNPEFEKLYSHLTTSLLENDGSTKNGPRADEHKALQEKLKTAQTEAAKSELLRTNLAYIDHSAKELPAELLEVVDIVASQLECNLPIEDIETLQGEIEYFLDHLRPISQSLSTYLSSLALQISSLAHPAETDPRRLRALIPSLPDHTTHQLTHLTTQQSSLDALRLDLVATACTLLDAQSALLETLIRALEQNTHGAVARAARTHADHLDVVAQSMDAKLQLQTHTALTTLYTPRATTALQNYARHLSSTRARLQERLRTAREGLAGYEAAGPEMREIAARYRALGKEVEATRADIRRLGGEE
ncbi:MAG: hypothetical protein M1833_004143 [Piccolia ochrophora]|nr:MAG: hypothetical protein M1833_004143 [Piccolia ochrophora]